MSSNLQRAAALLGALRDGGVRRVVASPGSRSTPLVLAADALGLALHMVLDERAAAFVALGLARASDAPVALVCTSGTAGAHWLPALIEANASGVPLVAITADRPAAAQYVGAPQTIDQTRLFGAHVAAAFSLPETSSAGHVRLVALRALAHRAAPVHLNMAFDEPLWDPAERLTPPAPASLTLAHAVGAAPEALRAAVAGARRGVLVAGAHLSEAARRAVLAAGAHLGWPVLADAASGLRALAEPHDAQQVLISRGEAIVRTGSATLQPDLVVRVGHAPTTRAVLEWLARLEAPMWLVDERAVHDPATRGAHVILAPVAGVLGDLLAVAPAQDRAFTRSWARAERAAAEALDHAVTAPAPLWEGAVAARVMASAQPEQAVVVASSMPIRDVDLFAGRLRGRWYVNRGANGIDGLVATAAGAALAHPEGALLLLGDLAFRHDLSGLQAALQLASDAAPLALRVVVVDNGGGGIFGFLPIAEHPAFTRCFLTPQVTDVVALAQGLGAAVSEVGTFEALESALTLPPRGVEVVVVRVDREHSRAQRRSALEAASQAAARAVSAER